MYRFLLSPRWLGYAALTVVLAAVMVLLGFWQLDRYHQRGAVNARIDAAAGAPPSPVERVLAEPLGGRVGAPAPTAAVWTRVVTTGRYDPTYQILVRNRTVNDAVGFEVLTPLIRADGAALLVDRGWIPSPEAGAGVAPDVPAVPGGPVRVTGRIHPAESRAGRPQRIEGKLQVSRIAPAAVAPVLPYPVLGAYVTLEQQEPPADGRFVAVLPEHENALQNGGYVLQWWMFAAMTVFGFGYLARREAHGPLGEIDRDLADLASSHP